MSGVDFGAVWDWISQLLTVVSNGIGGSLLRPARANAGTAERPIAIRNLGNTCYLSAVLQVQQRLTCLSVFNSQVALCGR